MPAILFKGMTFEISQAGTVFTSIGSVTGYSLDGAGRSEIDTTDNASTSKEFAFGLKDNGTLSIELNYDPDGAGLAIAEASYASDTPYFFQVVYANGATSGTKKAFQGYVVNISDSSSVDDKVSGTIEVKLSGDITKTAAV